MDTDTESFFYINLVKNYIDFYIFCDISFTEPGQAC